MPIHVEIATCKRCGHEWIKRTAKPVECPVCKRTDWNKTRNKAQGYMWKEQQPKKKKLKASGKQTKKGKKTRQSYDDRFFYGPR